MIRKQKEYSKALRLRQNGKSIRYIAKLLKVSPATINVWCKHISLSSEQIQHLLKSKSRITHLRRLAKRSHLNKTIRVKKLVKEASSSIEILSKHELFLIGIALYWAEGFKGVKEQRLGFCNSDPRMIKFMINWFKKALGIKLDNFTLRAEFNESHKDREKEIKNYWSKQTMIPLTQFEKSYLHKAVWLKDYPNRSKYFGVLRIRIRKSSQQLYKMRGWIKGLSNTS